jgi:hypothetical protein
MNNTGKTAGPLLVNALAIIMLLPLACRLLPVSYEERSVEEELEMAEPVQATESSKSGTSNQPGSEEAGPKDSDFKSREDAPKSCKTPLNASPEQGPLRLYLVHGREVTEVKPAREIVLRNKRFALLFNMADYDRYCGRFASASVMASGNADFIENAVQPSMRLTPATPLGPGWGMAPDTSYRYDTMLLTDEGMHYLIFDTDGGPENQRLSIQKEISPGIYQFRWDIFDVARIGDHRLEPLPRKRSTFAVLFFRDQDLDDVVETGEFLVFYITIDPEDS